MYKTTFVTKVLQHSGELFRIGQVVELERHIIGRGVGGRIVGRIHALEDNYIVLDCSTKRRAELKDIEFDQIFSLRVIYGE